jgi:3-oxoacyl-[acyl-carrier-protein] synthase III
MRIVTVQHSIPSRMITNQDVLDLIRERNKAQLSAVELNGFTSQVQAFLELAGTRTRYMLADGERAIEFGVRAGAKAIEKSQLTPEDIDFVIYASVARGWLEPATSTIIQAQLGLRNACTFDIAEACAGWIRAMQVAHSLIKTKAYRRGIIINCECGLLQHHFDLPSGQDLTHRLASFTVGEAATATLVDSENPEDDFHFRFRSYGEHFNLCMVPLPNVANFVTNGEVDARYAPGYLFSRSQDLVATTIKKTVELFRSAPNLAAERFDTCFGHAASERSCELVLKRLGIPWEIAVPTHARFGNTVSASVPLGMSVALEDGRLRRGNRVLVVVGSAGISVGIATFGF